MKKLFILFSLCVLSSAFVHSQTEVESDCKANLENIFKAHTLKVKYEAVQSLYHELDIKDSIINNKRNLLSISKECWNGYFLSITGFPMDGYIVPAQVERTEEEKNLWKLSSEELARYFERTRDSTRKKSVPVKEISDEEMNKYVKQLNCTPEKALKEYLNFIQNIKSEKEKYLKCIDAELAKGDSSEYVKDVLLYSFHPGWESLLPPLPIITRLDFLKVFKEFILNDNQRDLPDNLRMKAYLKCGCKI